MVRARPAQICCLGFIDSMCTAGMTLAFFFNVSDTGSWLEIGQTISFFCISSLLLVWSAGICALGEWLLGPPVPPPKTKAL